jgi:hypothetical protein
VRQERQDDASPVRASMEEELIFYLRYYRKLVPDSRAKFDRYIEELVEKLKELED